MSANATMQWRDGSLPAGARGFIVTHIGVCEMRLEHACTINIIFSIYIYTHYHIMDYDFQREDSHALLVIFSCKRRTAGICRGHFGFLLINNYFIFFIVVVDFLVYV
jgi:hypothetical protein